MPRRLSVVEAAAVLGLSTSRVYQLAQGGRLGAEAGESGATFDAAAVRLYRLRRVAWAEIQPGRRRIGSPEMPAGV